MRLLLAAIPCEKGDVGGNLRQHLVVLATQAGSTVDEDFPGIAALIDPGGEVVDRLPDWRPGALVVEV